MAEEVKARQTIHPVAWLFLYFDGILLIMLGLGYAGVHVSYWATCVVTTGVLCILWLANRT